ncbi:MAG: hypothetical protein ACRDWE_00825 [Acidimicrobiales bacterium]
MRSEKWAHLHRRHLRAFCGATVLVVVLWLLAVLAVGVVVRPAPQLFPPRVSGVVLWPRNGNPVDLGAWHTMVQVLVLVALGTIVVAGVDRLRRARRRARHARPAAARHE